MLSAPASFTGAATITRFTPRAKYPVELLLLEELAGAFQHDVAAEIAPGDAVRGRRGAEADAPVADADGAVVLGAEALTPAAVDAVEFQQMRGGRRRRL